MMNEDINNDDDDEEDVILDRQNLHPHVSTTSEPIHSTLNQLRSESYDDSSKLSKGKTLIIAVTCLSIGMLTGLLGPTFSYLQQKLSTNLSSIVWLVVIKAVGFLLGICLSGCLYTAFNICCLLGLSCLSISFCVCSLSFITDLTTFYLTSLILGIGLGLCYSGVDGLYNHVWHRPTLSSIRWLHLSVTLGTILSTLMLFPLTNQNNTQSIRPRRTILNNINLTSICHTSFCCYDYINPNQTYLCYENVTNHSSDCTNIFSSCKNSSSNICYIEKSHTWCLKDYSCLSDIKSNCSIGFLNNSRETFLKNSSTLTSTSTTSTISVTPSHHHKPSVAESNNDDLSKNFFYLKMKLLFHSITSTDLIYLIVSLLFFILSMTYSLLAIRGEILDLFSIKNLNPLSLLFIQPHRIINNSHQQISLLSDVSSFKFVFLLVLFYFVLSSIEYSCTYFTYLFGRKIQLSERNSLLLQLCYLFGRLIDILVNHIWFLLNKYLTLQTDLISIKSLIFFRLIILFIICFSNLFQQLNYVIFFSIGLCLTSLSSLILYWIERDLSLNYLLVRIILFTVIISEIISPLCIFYKLEYFIQFYLLISLSLLMFLFMIIIYTSKKWQRNRLYRLLPTSIELDENSDNEVSNSSNFIL